MPKICYKRTKFHAPTLGIIRLANEVIAEYDEQGFTLTVRQLFYRLVALGHLDNTRREYKNLVRNVSRARESGLIDWEAIVDRTRFLRKNPHWSSALSVCKAAQEAFMMDRWQGQPYRPEVWIEKDALVDVLSTVCDDLDVAYFSGRGYASQSAMWRAALRLDRFIANGQEPIILHMADHDPSGLDMTRDLEARLALFAVHVEIKRLALNFDQILERDPPPTFTKFKDSRSPAYVDEFGYDCWELDALEPGAIVDLIETAILEYRDDAILESVIEKEKPQKELLERAVAQVETWGKDAKEKT